MKEREFLENVGKTIKAERKAMKMSQKELAAACGIGHAAMSEIESGNWATKITTLRKIALALHVDIKEFL